MYMLRKNCDICYYVTIQKQVVKLSVLSDKKYLFGGYI